MARTPRTWTGARSPSGLKRVRQAERRHEILQPRRSVAKTLVAKAVRVSTGATNGEEPAVALAEALSALDRAAKVGAIHPNAAARRKSRLVRKVNAALGGTQVVATARVAKQTSKAQAQKAAKARIAAGRADKAKGAQTAAGKARAALTRTTRTESGGAGADEPTKTAARSKSAATPKTTTKAPSRPAAKAAASKSTAKASAPKAPARKSPAKG